MLVNKNNLDLMNKEKLPITTRKIRLIMRNNKDKK